jgi:GNAT superfamily N-acetyltransferase
VGKDHRAIVSTSALTIRPLLAADLDAQQALVELAGWNQTRRDLERLLDHQPHGCFAGVLDGRPVATVTTTSHGASLAWIGMMLVHPDYRRRGVATALMERAVEALRRQGIACLKLDATPDGAAVYSRIGFESECGLHRYARAGRATGAGASTSRPAGLVPTGRDWTIPMVDEVAFGADRSAWLMRLAADSRVEVVAGGYGMLRPGRRAAYLGPVVAETPAAAHRVVERLLEGVHAPLLWDLPDANPAATQLARALGFEPTRELVRMWRGDRPLAGRYELQFGLTDFATG